MDRLTYFEGGHWWLKLCDTTFSQFPAVDRLAAYEDTGLEPEEIMGLCSMHERAKMAELLRVEENRPLTLDELRKMDGEPVWVMGVSCINNFKGHWDICDWENGEVVTFPYCAESPDISKYGITWTAYRRKPEEETT